VGSRVNTHFLEASMNHVAGVEEVEPFSHIGYLERG